MPRLPQAMATIRALRMCRKENMELILEVCDRLLLLLVFMAARSRERRLGAVGELALQRTELRDVQALEVDRDPVEDRIVRNRERDAVDAVGRRIEQQRQQLDDHI